MVALPCLRYRNQSAKPFPLSYLINPTTIVEHIRKKRMDLNLSQAVIAKRLGKSDETIKNWENRHHEPQIKFYPRFIDFLGYHLNVYNEG